MRFSRERCLRQCQTVSIQPNYFQTQTISKNGQVFQSDTSLPSVVFRIIKFCCLHQFDKVIQHASFTKKKKSQTDISCCDECQGILNKNIMILFRSRCSPIYVAADAFTKKAFYLKKICIHSTDLKRTYLMSFRNYISKTLWKMRRYDIDDLSCS